MSLEKSEPDRKIIGQWPTPIHEMTNLTQALQSPRIFFKREDLSGFALGGNKTRQLEYILADFQNKSCDTMIACGGIHSNYLRILSAAIKKMGHRMIVVYFGSRPSESEGNFLLCKILGVEMIFTNDDNRSSSEALSLKIGQELEKSGARPYVLPRGGTTPLGCLGYFHLIDEIRDQEKILGIKFDHIFVPTGSCGTLAGVVAGSDTLQAQRKIWGLSVSRPQSEVRQRLSDLIPRIRALVGLDKDNSLHCVEISDEAIGPGYGVPTVESQRAIELVAQSEGIFLDPVFTGKAFAQLLKILSSNSIKSHENILFIHCGGHPSLFVAEKNLSKI